MLDENIKKVHVSIFSGLFLLTKILLRVEKGVQPLS